METKENSFSLSLDTFEFAPYIFYNSWISVLFSKNLSIGRNERHIHRWSKLGLFHVSVYARIENVRGGIRVSRMDIGRGEGG